MYRYFSAKAENPGENFWHRKAIPLIRISVVTTLMGRLPFRRDKPPLVASSLAQSRSRQPMSNPFARQ
jgi:hypothetical protein